MHLTHSLKYTPSAHDILQVAGRHGYLIFVVLICGPHLSRGLLRLCGLAFTQPISSSKNLPDDTLGLEINANPLAPATLVKPLPIKPSCLPIELVERIADFLFELKPPIPDAAGDAPITCLKPVWLDVKGWMEASVNLHSMGFMRWLRVITVNSPDDWTILFQHQSLIR